MLARHPRILVFFLAVLAVTAAAAMPQDDPATPEEETGAAELEEIRGVAIRYYEEKKPRLWEVFVEELKQGGIFLKGEFPGIGPSIGFWKCEAYEGGIDLIRDIGPPESGGTLTVQFYVRLVKKDGRWTAVGHAYRELRWQSVPVETPPPTPQSVPRAR